MSTIPADSIALAFRQACEAELEALKPGNVSVYSAGHGMSVDDFRRSAECTAGIIAWPGLGVGARVLRSVQATRQAVGCNTNLGILLLCAPLAKAVESGADRGFDLRQVLLRVLRELDQHDAERVFQAIRLAAPAGLGHSDRHDVRQPARVTLLEAMTVAEQRDRIAYQYSHGFEDIFATGLPVLRAALDHGVSLPWATAGVYLNFLASFPDSHIMRKQGAEVAEQTRREASEILAMYNKRTNPKTRVMSLLAFDKQLKDRGINPGTCADLTVATHFAGQLQDLSEQNLTASPSRAALNTRGCTRADAGMLSLVSQATGHTEEESKWRKSTTFG